ncbi:MAG: flippase-like domain-containing protein [Cytophagaceae bacterium]|nr:flippase-like domain-containing protein [Cytophagaceae bacterium]
MQKKSILFKALSFGLVSVGIAWSLKERQEQWPDFFSASTWAMIHPAGLITALLLLPFNIGLEARKWMFCLQNITNISMWQSIQSVLSGYALAFVTPHGIGDYAGRIFHLRQTPPMEAAGALLLCRMSQFYITLYTGTIALVYYLYFQIEAMDAQYWTLVGFIVSLTILLIGLFSQRDMLADFLHRNIPWSWFQSFLKPIRTFSHGSVMPLFGMALLRHLVFCLQFGVLLWAAGVQVSIFVMLMGCSFVFLIKSIVPTLLELGVREAAAIVFFGMLIENHQFILLASISLWVINFVFPSLVGAGFIFVWKNQWLR